jgi:hypothetical protein
MSARSLANILVREPESGSGHLCADHQRQRGLARRDRSPGAAEALAAGIDSTGKANPAGISSMRTTPLIGTPVTTTQNNLRVEST